MQVLLISAIKSVYGIRIVCNVYRIFVSYMVYWALDHFSGIFASSDYCFLLIMDMTCCNVPPLSLQWRHNECDGVSNHRRLHGLLKRLFRHRFRKTSKLCITSLCEGNSPVTHEFPSQRTKYAKNVSLWWRHHDSIGISWTKDNLHDDLEFTSGCFLLHFVRWINHSSVEWSDCRRMSIMVVKLNHRPLDCLCNILQMSITQKTALLTLCDRNPLVTDEFPL